MSSIGISSYRPAFMGTTHMVSSGHYLAATAGFRILEEGGNAVDAGVASGIAVNVTHGMWTSFAGVAPIAIYLANTGEVVTISGLGRWPKAATAEYFRQTYGEIPIGLARCIVPSACDAWLTALEHYGTMSFEHVVGPSLELADKGFPASESYGRLVEAHRDVIERWPSSRELLMPDGEIPRPGQPFFQKDLAGVFRQMIEVERANTAKGREGAIRAARDFFYKGEVAERMVRFCQEQGGLLTMEDFADFNVEIEKAQEGTYKDYTIHTCGPWCQGPTLIQVLNIMEGLDLTAMGHNSPDYIHACTEAVKLAFSDRHTYYGDPDMVEVPMAGLLSKDFAAERRNALDMKKAWPEMPPPGDPWRYQDGKASSKTVVGATPRPGPLGEDTSYTCVVDRWGNAFSATPSDSIGMASPIVPGLGMIISNRGVQSWLEPEHPSCIAPWKRPRLTPNPAIALKNGSLFMPIGTPGGDIQPQAMAQVFLNMVEFGMNPQQAIEAPRAGSRSFPNSFWPHAYYPGLLNMESRIEGKVGEELSKRGHKIEMWNDWAPSAGSVCAIMVDTQRGILIGGADLRRDAYAMGR